jgi:hypothetical protein
MEIGAAFAHSAFAVEELDAVPLNSTAASAEMHHKTYDEQHQKDEE